MYIIPFLSAIGLFYCSLRDWRRTWHTLWVSGFLISFACAFHAASGASRQVVVIPAPTARSASSPYQMALESPVVKELSRHLVRLKEEENANN